MVKFEGEYPIAFIYLKPEGSDHAWTIPFCEVFDGKVIAEKTNGSQVAILAKNKEGSPVLEIYTNRDFANLIKSNLERWQKDFTIDIEDFAVQPEGEPMSEDVKRFCDKYDDESHC